MICLLCAVFYRRISRQEMCGEEVLGWFKLWEMASVLHGLRRSPLEEMNEQADCKGKGERIERLADLRDSGYQWEGSTWDGRQQRPRSARVWTEHGLGSTCPLSICPHCTWALENFAKKPSNILLALATVLHIVRRRDGVWDTTSRLPSMLVSISPEPRIQGEAGKEAWRTVHFIVALTSWSFATQTRFPCCFHGAISPEILSLYSKAFH